MPTLTIVNRRMRLLYNEGPSFAFNAINWAATDQNVFDLGTAISQLQSEEPESIRDITVRHFSLS